VAYPGSLGDQAMLFAAISKLRESKKVQLGVLTPATHDEWEISKSINVEDISNSGGGNYFYFMIWRYLTLLNNYDACFVFGADVLDGGHGDSSQALLLMADLAARSGLRSTILGCSINQHPSDKMKIAWKRLSKSVRVCARDPISYQRLSNLCRQKPQQVADVAFLLKPENGTELVNKHNLWHNQQNKGQRKVLAINMCGHILRMFKDKNNNNNLYMDAARYIEIMAEIVRGIYHQIQNLSLLLIAHDRRPVGSDVVLNDLLCEVLHNEFGEHIFNVPGEARADEIKQIVASADLVFTGRMHLAIASLGQGTPCIGLEYQGKYEGLFSSFGIGNLCIKLEEFICGDKKYIVEKAYYALNNSDVIRSQIDNYLPKITELSLRNFADDI
jgi:polysaccharide pyruvyl transferase WcaK-like protein